MGKMRRSFTPTPSSYDNLAHSNAFVSKILLYLIAASVIIFFIWAATTQVEEIARGEGVVIPSGQNKVVQNLEGGVIANIAVSEGDIVKKGDILLQISNQDSQSKVAATQTQKLSLEAKKMRLQAQAASKEFAITTDYDATLNHFLQAQKSLYNKRIQALESQISALKQQYREKKAKKQDAKQQITHMQSSIELLNKEIAMLQPLVQEGIKSQIDLYKLQRELSQKKQQLQTTIISIDIIDAQMQEIQDTIAQTQQEFAADSLQELNEVNAKIQQLQSVQKAQKDRVSRTLVRAPEDGIVQSLFVNTIGGAVKPAQDLVEIVPVDENLIVEVKVKPADIGFIHHNQKALVRFSAYDFAIYGGVEAKVVSISPDTIKQDSETYYLLRVQTDTDKIHKGGKDLRIIPGMVSDVDIIVGEKTVLAYLMHPILRTLRYSFSEH